ncbi:MAG: hypothetical protein PHE28_03670 [Bacteroidales bacterium]|jgi:hypothetical protein|nr:hypothetical protein [Bacteroidales bacterium]MDX9798017.1 hypothetical protein [Bacteroidales bacterium]
MKKLIFILFAIFGSLFFFSCEDENINNDYKPVSKSTSFQNIKNYVGETISRVNGQILIKGYKLIKTQESSYENNITTKYVYLSNDSIKYIELNTFNDKVYGCSYHIGDMYTFNNNVDNIFSEFRNLSNEANVLFANLSYKAIIDENPYPTHELFLNEFDSIKYEMNFCEEKWEQSNYLSAKITYFNEDFFLPTPPYPINHIVAEYFDFRLSPYANSKVFEKESKKDLF